MKFRLDLELHEGGRKIHQETIERDFDSEVAMLEAVSERNKTMPTNLAWVGVKAEDHWRS